MEQQTVDKGGLTFRPEDYASDLAKLAAEQGIPPAVEAPKAEPTTIVPVQPPQATVTPEPPATQATAPVTQAEVAVPDKFKAPDGTLDMDKLEKSTANAELAKANAEQAIAKYQALQKDMSRKINEAAAAKNALLTSIPLPAIDPNVKPNTQQIPFDQILEQDAQTIGLGKAMVKGIMAAKELALEEARKEFSSIRQVQEETDSRRQIEEIGKRDLWVYTPEGVNTLNQILTEQPYLWQALDPYVAAYRFSGRGGVSAVVERSGSQVLTPTPPAKATAPVPSAVAANMTPQSPSINLDSKEAIDSHLKTLTPKQQEEFFMKMGLPRFDAR